MVNSNTTDITRVYTGLVASPSPTPHCLKRNLWCQEEKKWAQSGHTFQLKMNRDFSSPPTPYGYKSQKEPFPTVSLQDVSVDTEPQPKCLAITTYRYSASLFIICFAQHRNSEILQNLLFIPQNIHLVY